MASGEILVVGPSLAAPPFRAVREPPLQDPHPFLAEFLVLRQFPWRPPTNPKACAAPVPEVSQPIPRTHVLPHAFTTTGAEY